MSLLRLPRRVLRLVCHGLMAALLFAQLAAAAHACERMLPAPAQLAAATMPCHHDGSQDAVAADASLCLEHCRSGQQVAGDAAAVPALPAAVLLPSHALAFDRSAPLQALVAARDFVLAAAPPPPLALLHCCRRD